MPRHPRVLYLLVGTAGAMALVGSMVLPATFVTNYGALLTFYLLAALPLYAAGLFAYLKAPQHPTARRLLVVGSLFSLADFFEVLLGRLYTSHGAFDGLWALNLAFQVSGVLMLVFSVRLFGLFPDGRARARYERALLGALWLYALVPFVLLVSRPTLALPAEVFRALPGSVPVPHVASPLYASWLEPLNGVTGALVDLETPLLFVGALVLMGLRARRAGPVQRSQLKWVLYAVGLMAALQVGAQLVRAAGLLSGTGSDAVVTLASAPVAIFVVASMLIALFRHRLLDIDLVIRRSVVYGALWLLIGAGYVGVATGLGLAAGHRLPVAVAIVATVAATLVIQPLRRRLERLAERMVYGPRLSGYELLSRFGETLEHAFDTGQLAPQVAAAVRDGLGLTWARVSLCIDEGVAQPAGAAGIGLDDDAAPEFAVPLVHAGQRLGTIECGRRAEGELRPADHELVATIARQAALGIHNSRLAAELSARLDEIRRQAEELAASRVRIVQTQDAERRRIERNIHDGVQQEIVALVANVRLARNQLHRDPDLADATLAQLQHQARQTLEDLRELSRGIHPAVLTDRGLLEAIEERTSRLPLGVGIEAPAALRGVHFAPETDAAAYYFVCEALANVLKHALASHAIVRLHLEGDRLIIEVADDGVGFAPAEVSGTGLRGLRDRIETASGSLRVTSRPGHGTALVAVFPAPAEETARAR